MKLETIEVRLPSHWASSIINGDDSGIDDDDIREMNETLNHLGLARGSCVDVYEGGFQRAPSYLPWLLDGNYATFTFLVDTDKEGEK